MWLEEHQIGILTTIALHLLLFCAVLVLKISSNIEREHSIMLDLSQIDFDMEAVEAEDNQEQQPVSQTILQDNYMRNIPVNVADRAVESIDRMIREIKSEENINEPAWDVPAEPAYNESYYSETFSDNTTGEQTIYRGPTTVSYELTGRRHIWMPAPVYRCRAGGTIVVDIVVNGNGYVISTEINSSRSNSADPCLIDAAKSYAERSRFNESPLARQQGTITYIFQPQ